MTVTVGFLHPGHWSACFANSLLDMMFYDAANNQNVVSNPHGLASQECGAGNIHSGRNKIATDVIGGNTEWLFMIDSDMGFAADTVDRLIEAADPTERPIVGGLAFACKSDGAGDLFARRYRACPTVYQMYETDTEVGFVPMFDYPRDQLVEVDGTGMACVLIHRSVLEKIYADHGDRWFNPIEVPKGPTGRTEFGEDLSFCIRARAAGFPIFIHTGIKTTHDKGGVFLDEGTYDLQQAMKAIA